MEGLSSIIINYEAVGLIHGCKVIRDAPSVSFLLLSDDCYFFFFRASRIEACVMKSILIIYERISHQAINYSSPMLFLVQTRSLRIDWLVCDNLEVGEVSVPLKFLGKPMYVGKNKADVFKFLTDHVRHKLQGWMDKDISNAGKITLLKSAAQTISNFWMSIFLIPSVICEAIEKLMNSYWWGRGSNGKGIS